MKRVISLLASAVMLIGLASCKDNDVADTSSDLVSSIVYNSLVPEYATEGKIDGVSFAVGANIDEVVEFYNGDGPSIDDHGGTAAVSSDDSTDTSSTESVMPDLGEEVVYDLTIRGLDTGDKIIKMYSYDTRYFYYNASPDSGIAYIAYFADTFGYMIGHTTYDDIKTTIEANPLEDRIAEEDEMFFMVQPLIGTKMISYKYGDYVLNFFFDENDKLFSTTIYNPRVWTE